MQFLGQHLLQIGLFPKTSWVVELGQTLLLEKLHFHLPLPRPPLDVPFIVSYNGSLLYFLGVLLPKHLAHSQMTLLPGISDPLGPMESSPLCMGWTSSFLLLWAEGCLAELYVKVLPHSTWEHDLPGKWGLHKCNQVKRRSQWTRWALNLKMCILLSSMCKDTDTRKAPWGDRGQDRHDAAAGPGPSGITGHRHKRGDTRGSFSLRTSRGLSLHHLHFRLLVSRVVRTHFCCFKPPSLWYLLQLSPETHPLPALTTHQSSSGHQKGSQ